MSGGKGACTGAQSSGMRPIQTAETNNRAVTGRQMLREQRSESACGDPGKDNWDPRFNKRGVEAAVRGTIRPPMSGHALNLRKLAASVTLCVLVIASVAAPICPGCSKLELPSSSHIIFGGSQHNEGQNCDKDGCSCCGFQIVAPPHGVILALSESTSISDFFSALPGPAPVFSVYRPPRR